MPGGFPLGLEWCNGTSYGVSQALSEGTNIPPSSSSNTKGNYVQIVASTTSDIDVLCVQLVFNDGSDTGGYAVDIAIGPSGSEKIIINNLMLGASLGSTDTPQGANYVLPIFIPSGTRIAARSAEIHGAQPGVFITLQGFAGSFTQMYSVSGYDNVGFVSTGTTGTNVTPHVGSKGSWVQLVASTVADYMGFYAVIDQVFLGGAGGDMYALIDIGIGASGSEKVIVPDLSLWNGSSLNNGVPYIFGPFMIPIPAGTRVAARANSSDSTSDGFSVGLLSFRQ